MSLVFILLVVMQFKHFIADYPLQNKYMLGKFKPDGWELPLAAHCGVHFVFTFVISYLVLYNVVAALSLGVFDFVIHFFMDRIKASPDLLGKFKALTKQEYIKYDYILNNSTMKSSNGKVKVIDREMKWDAEEKIKGNTYFWWSLGIDQMVHHLTDILIVYIIICGVYDVSKL